MVFARTKMVISDPVFPPREAIVWEFPVKEPKRFYEQFKDILMDSFAVDERQIQETSFSWDKANNYKTKWLIVKELDDLSFISLDIKFNCKTTEDGGFVTLEVKAHIRTEYPQDTIFQKSFFYEVGRMIVDKLFYEKQRAKYMAEAQRLTKKFESAVKRFSIM